jgi:hypothetical protein
VFIKNDEDFFGPDLKYWRWVEQTPSTHTNWERFRKNWKKFWELSQNVYFAMGSLTYEERSFPFQKAL